MFSNLVVLLCASMSLGLFTDDSRDWSSRWATKCFCITHGRKQNYVHLEIITFPLKRHLNSAWRDPFHHQPFLNLIAAQWASSIWSSNICPFSCLAYKVALVAQSCIWALLEINWSILCCPFIILFTACNKIAIQYGSTRSTTTT